METDLIALLDGRRGHFRMESGFHSEQWFHLDALLGDRARLQPFVAELARRLAVYRIDAVCGPMTGGAELAARIGRELGIEIFSSERFEPAGADGLFPVQYRVPVDQRARLAGKSLAIVDDAISAGSAVRGTYADLLAGGARPVALGALFVFGGAATKFAAERGLTLDAIAWMPFSMWPPADCPHCAAGVPLEKVSDASRR